MQLNILETNNNKNIYASVIGFLDNSDHLALMKQHLENIREMPQGKTSLSGSLNFQRAQKRLRDCQNLLSSVSVFLLYTLDCCWVLKVILK